MMLIAATGKSPLSKPVRPSVSGSEHAEWVERNIRHPLPRSCERLFAKIVTSLSPRLLHTLNPRRGQIANFAGRLRQDACSSLVWQLRQKGQVDVSDNAWLSLVFILQDPPMSKAAYPQSHTARGHAFSCCLRLRHVTITVRSPLYSA